MSTQVISLEDGKPDINFDPEFSLAIEGEKWDYTIHYLRQNLTRYLDKLDIKIEKVLDIIDYIIANNESLSLRSIVDLKNIVVIISKTDPLMGEDLPLYIRMRLSNLARRLNLIAISEEG